MSPHVKVLFDSERAEAISAALRALNNRFARLARMTAR